ncbi:MAG: hypothetical protein Q6L60_11210 [Thermostichus sp. HHBFW_bins_43]
MILNGEQIDGVPLTLGQFLSLQARASDPTGNDVSEQIEWRNAEGSLLGRGSRLEYQAESVKMETLSARVGSAQDRVSFTVSTADIAIAPQVKVIPDSLSGGVEYDEANGLLKLPLEERLPTLKAGDVVIGAATQVPPLKLLSLSQEGNHWRLRVQPALPKELIERGTATFEQEIDWSGDSGEVTLVDISPQPFHIGDVLDPRWSGFVQAGDPIQKGLKVTARASLDWKPTYKGSIEFDKDVGDGIASLIVDSIGRLSLGLRVSAVGNHKWGGDEIIDIESLLPAQKEQVKLRLPLFLLPIQLGIELQLVSIPDIEIENGAEVIYSLIGDLSYNRSYSQGTWTEKSTLTKVSEIVDSSGAFGEGIFIFQAAILSDIRALNEPSLTGLTSFFLSGRRTLLDFVGGNNDSLTDNTFKIGLLGLESLVFGTAANYVSESTPVSPLGGILPPSIDTKLRSRRLNLPRLGVQTVNQLDQACPAEPPLNPDDLPRPRCPLWLVRFALSQCLAPPPPNFPDDPLILAGQIAFRLIMCAVAYICGIRGGDLA